MRLLHVAPNYLPAWRYGGPIKSIHGLCRTLVELGHEVHVYTTNIDGAGTLDVPVSTPIDRDGVKVWYFPVGFPRRIYRAPEMGSMLAQQLDRYDFVHLHSTYLWPMWAAARLASRAHVPYVLTPRGTLVKELVKQKSRFVKTAWIELIERRTIRDAAFLHVTSEHEFMALKHFDFELPPVEIVPNGIDLPSSVTDTPQADSHQGRVLLFIGRLSWEKGLDRLIRAMEFIPNTRLLIVGNDDKGYQAELEDLAHQCHVIKQIEFLGPVYGEEKDRLLNEASMVVVPSYSENFGNVVLEAWAHGCPVAMTPEVGLASIAKDIEAAAVVPGAPKDMGAALSALLENRDTLHRMALRGRELAANKFSWFSVGRLMEAAYMKYGTPLRFANNSIS